MGNAFSRFFPRLFQSKEVRILMLGLNSSGKTTILYKLKEGKPIITIPTVGFNVESLLFKNLKLNVWDVGGQSKIRPLWRHYFTGTRGLLFVIDSQDKERIEEASIAFSKIINDREMKSCIILVYANKQDHSDALSPTFITQKLGLDKIFDRKWFVQPSCALTGEGLAQGLMWLSKNIDSK